MLGSTQVINSLQILRNRIPLVLNLTNAVVTNFTANALLALGASPLMSSSRQEIIELLGISQALLLNIGTVHQRQLDIMHLAGEKAAEMGLPIILDPVGAGASKLRTQAALDFLQQGWVQILRANASEIMHLAGDMGSSKGVDSLHSAEQALKAGLELGSNFSCLICISGVKDYVLDQEQIIVIDNGHQLMARVTGMGCAASALVAAFAAVHEDMSLAAAAGMAVTAIAGELAANEASGPGSLQQNFLDQLFLLSPNELQGLRIELRRPGVAF